ncbi:MAG: tRNA pseudouridine(38-40) synthase TruA [Thermoflavifilum sp.]|nr:tRNA pseudouridine(38-40) synthase TruA [Thermoflavifilum sp.]MCL6513517.1 tRNA pseudouridine(38-40) synthase TruA [Alicyclobacillus sp.]
MQKVKLIIAYDGTDFHGFARQQGLRTVQGILEEVLAGVLGHPVEVFGSGRTDAGVHARAQVVHFQQEKGPPPEKWPYILLRRLPPDIVAVAAEPVPDDFHARFSVRWKTYRYSIARGEVPDIFRRRFTWHVPGPLNLDEMRQAAAALVGTHDFTSFCAAATPVEDKRRTIAEIRFEPGERELHIYCTGNGFLQHMVRIIVGTLVQVGQGRRAAAEIADILAARDRRAAGPTAPPQGLVLWSVEY